MKTRIYLFCILSMLGSLHAQRVSTGNEKDLMLWPIQGEKAGENILYRPQEYIGTELNFNKLFIKAEYGDSVLAPADGTIKTYGLVIQQSLISMTMMGDGHSFDAMRQKAQASRDRFPVPFRYVTGMVSLKLNNKNTLHIVGLEGNKNYKTGMKVKRGEFLGTAGYAYKAITEPHIFLSLNNAKSQVIDPMTPFGLKSTFLAPARIKIPEKLSSMEALHDFHILIQAIKECFPSLYDVIDPQAIADFDSVTCKFLQSRAEISYHDFYKILKRTVALIHDSHLNILTPDPAFSAKTLYAPHIFFGRFGDSLIVTYVQSGYEDYIGKRILSVNGIPSLKYIKHIESTLPGYDTKNESVKEAIMANNWNRMFENDIDRPRTTELIFADGQHLTDNWVEMRRVKSLTPSMSHPDIDYHQRAQKYRNTPYLFKKLNDSVAYFGLSTFALDETQMDNLTDSLQAYFDFPYLIMDLRNNPGGNAIVEDQMLTYFLNKPSIDTKPYSLVNKPGQFHSFQYCLNYDSSMIIFPDAIKAPDGNGYVLPSQTNRQTIPDSILNYKGKLYLLTGEGTISAASTFASKLIRNHRAVSVGRETASGYHFVTAFKFADIRLPHSYISIRIPLVKSVFDTAVTARTPEGRGLMPDYPVPLSYEEVMVPKEDIILNHTLQLISQGKYLGENPFSSIDKPDKQRKSFPWIPIGCCFLATYLIFFDNGKKK